MQFIHEHKPALAIAVVALVVVVPRALDFLPQAYLWDEEFTLFAARRMVQTPTIDPGWYNWPGAVLYLHGAIYGVGALLGEPGLGWLNWGPFGQAETARLVWTALVGRLVSVACFVAALEIGRRMARHTLGSSRWAWVPVVALGANPVVLGWVATLRPDAPALLAVHIAWWGGVRYLREPDGRRWRAACLAASLPFVVKFNPFAGIALALAALLGGERVTKFAKTRLPWLLGIPILLLLLTNPMLVLAPGQVVARVLYELEVNQAVLTGTTPFGGVSGSPLVYRLLWVWPMLYGPLRYVLGIAGLIVLWRRGDAIRRFPVLMIAPYVLFVLTVSNQPGGQYLFPYSFILMLGATVALKTLLERIAAPSGRRVLVASVAIAVLAVCAMQYAVEAAERANWRRMLEVVQTDPAIQEALKRGKPVYFDDRRRRFFPGTVGETLTLGDDIQLLAEIARRRPVSYELLLMHRVRPDHEALRSLDLSGNPTQELYSLAAANLYAGCYGFEEVARYPMRYPLHKVMEVLDPNLTGKPFVLLKRIAYPASVAEMDGRWRREMEGLESGTHEMDLPPRLIAGPSWSPPEEAECRGWSAGDR